MTQDVPVFGSHREGCSTRTRPSAYALLIDESGRLAVVRTPAGLFLPGGGMEAGEDAQATIRRETMEECGLRIVPRAIVGRAIEIVHSSPPPEHCVEKDSLFITADLDGATDSREPDHELIWMTIGEASERLTHGSQRWAAQQARTAGALREDGSTRSWDRIADGWVTHADTNDYRNLFLMPLMLHMLGEVSGRRLLDLGCGEGGYSRELARRGARVTGIDGSARLIEVARRRAREEGLEIEHLCLNASALTLLGSATFDCVLAAMSLMDVEDYDRAVREAHRVLVEGGEMLMSITHPCFSGPVARWIRDAEGRPQVFAVDRYLDREVWESFMTRSFREPYLRRHRPLEDYIGAALEAGLTLTELREPGATAEDVKLSPRFEKLGRIPYFLFLRWRK